MKELLKKHRNYVAGSITGVGVISALSIMMLLSPTAQVTAIDEKTIQETIGIVQPGPSPEDVPTIVDKWDWVPRDAAPSTGKPYLKVTEINTAPEKHNKIRLDQAGWLQGVINSQGEYVEISEQVKSEYFDFRNTVKNNWAYTEVTYPDGNTKYYHIEFHEVP